MRVRVILRLTPSENRKNRPDWYSKETSLRSLVSAIDTAREAGLDVDFSAVLDVSSGRHLAPGVARLLLDNVDTVMPIRGGTAAKSWRPVVRLVRDSIPYADDDLLYFIEDDYLHLPDALIALADGTTDYRLLYAHEKDHGRIGAPQDGWASVPGGTSSFAVTGAAFRADATMHLLLSHGGGAWDELSWRGLGSHATPPDASYVLWPFTADSKWSRRWGLRPIRHSVFRAVTLVHSTQRSRSIALCVPIRATHVESDLLAEGADWAARAESLVAEAPTAVPELTVLVPVRDQREALQRTLGSVPSDTGTGLEVIVIDACSTDGSAQLARDVQKSTDRVQVVRLVAPCDRGLGLALGSALSAAPTVVAVRPGGSIDPVALRAASVGGDAGQATVVLRAAGRDAHAGGRSPR